MFFYFNIGQKYINLYNIFNCIIFISQKYVIPTDYLIRNIYKYPTNISNNSIIIITQYVYSYIAIQKKIFYYKYINSRINLYIYYIASYISINNYNIYISFSTFL